MVLRCIINSQTQRQVIKWYSYLKGAVMLFIDSCEYMCNKYPQLIMFPEIMFSLTNLDIIKGVCLYGLDNIMMYRRFIKSKSST